MRFVIQNEATGNFVDFDSDRGPGHVTEDKSVADRMKYNFKSRAEEDVQILEKICASEKYQVVDVV